MTRTTTARHVQPTHNTPKTIPITTDSTLAGSVRTEISGNVSTGAKMSSSVAPASRAATLTCAASRRGAVAGTDTAYCPEIPTLSTTVEADAFKTGMVRENEADLG
jgi:hypothetical protein